MQKENITTKNIWEFTKDDTIYISKTIKSTGNKHTFLCQFVMLVRNRVHGIVLEIDKATSWDGIKVGDEIHADFKSCGLYGKAGNDSNTNYHWFNTMGYAHKDIGEEVTEKVIKHPSYGLIGVNRTSSSGSTLFGSNIQHKNTFTIIIKRAEHHRHLNNDWMHGTEQLIEIELSGSQFIEMMTSMNAGDGIPCTIRQVGSQMYPDPPYENPLDTFQREFEAKLKNLGKQCESVVEDAVKMLKEKTNINKADRDFLLSAIHSIVQQVSSNIPFVNQQFNESVEKSVQQAKNEIETFFNHRITSLGLDAAKLKPELLLGNISNDTKEITGNEHNE